jgi:twitching motility protein PilT
MDPTPCPSGYSMPQLLGEVVSRGASDLHLQVGQAPVLRLSGEMEPLEGPALTPEDTRALIGAIIPPHDLQKAENTGGADFAIAFGEDARFRVSVLRSKGNYGVVFRLIPSKFLSMEQIGLPPMIKDLLTRPRGLILVTGPTGSGKSTTLASMVNWINEQRTSHIITIEDPIEYYHTHKQSVITQREVNVDVGSFADAIRGALRQDPDVILVGEMRDLETIEAAVTAAETGHLVFGTLHTTGAARTINRIVDAFPANTKEMIRIQLSASIVAVISQVLMRKKGGGRIAGFEIMVMTPAIANLIRENKVYLLESEIQMGGKQGMVQLDTYLGNLVEQDLVEASEAVEFTQNPKDFRDKYRISGGGD